jgi:lipopolysaccharide export system permease protein
VEGTSPYYLLQLTQKEFKYQAVGKNGWVEYISHMKPRFLPQQTLFSVYILRAHVGPFLFSFFTLMFLFLLQFVMKFIDQLIGKGLTAWVIIELIALNLAWMVVLAVPMSVLVATLMAFGDLSSRNEITAMKASGMSIYRMMAPAMIGAALIAALLVWFNNHVLPEANHRAKTLTIDIRRKKPTLAIVAGLFSQDIPGYSILVRKTFELSNELEGITLYDYTSPNRNVTITAERGTISFSPDYRKLIMILHRGEIHQLELDHKSAYQLVHFQSHRIAMDVEGFDFARSTEGTFSRGDRELGAQAMLAIIDSMEREKGKLQQQLHERVARELREQLTDRVAASGQAGTANQNLTPTAASLARTRALAGYVAGEAQRIGFIDKQIDQYSVEVHKKYSIPAACMVFVLVGLPLGVMARRGGFGIAATLSLGFFILYWACLIGGEKLADRGITSPFWGMWVANFIIGGMGILLTLRIGRETVIIHWDTIQRLIPQRWRRSWATREEGETSQA